MPIVFAAIVPHSPILIPAIGKENTDRLKLTSVALKKLEEDLILSEPDTIIIISPHGIVQQNAFTINLNPIFTSNFEEFGDFATKATYNGDVSLCYKIRESLETKAPVQMTSESKLDYGTAIPLFLLAKKLKHIKIIPLHYSGLDLNAHFELGKFLKREIMLNQNKVAIIASGDLSHRLEKFSPGGYSPKGKKYDKKIMEYLSKDNIPEILKFNLDLAASAGECGLKSFTILLGILNGINYQPKLLSYEAPFGVGYLAMNYKL